jgi:hypothetical protein
MVVAKRVFDVGLAQCGSDRPAFPYDDWVMLIAPALGRVAFLPEALVLYRQHDANAVGPRPSGLAQRVGSSASVRNDEAAFYRATAEWGWSRVRVLRELEQRLAAAPGDWPWARPAVRTRRWTRFALVHARRSELYGAGLWRRRPMQWLANAIQGDYGGRGHGGLGLSGMCRDGLFAFGLLDVAIRIAALITRSDR